MANMIRNNSALSMNEIARVAPAVFGQVKAEKLSDRYSFFETSKVLEALASAGWRAVYAAQGKGRTSNALETRRHVIRLRHADANLGKVTRVGDLFPELVLVNSHDGSSAYNLHAGIFRLVCGNGMIVADSTFAKVSIRHSNRTAQEVVDASFSVVKELPAIGNSIEAMRSVELSPSEQTIFAEAAARVRWEEGAIPLSAEKVLEPRRFEDRGSDLWRTMNRVQENLTQGGQRGRSATGRKLRTRAVGAVTEDTRINKALWHLAESMRKMKTGEASPESIAATA